MRQVLSLAHASQPRWASHPILVCSPRSTKCELTAKARISDRPAAKGLLEMAPHLPETKAQLCIELIALRQRRRRCFGEATCLQKAQAQWGWYRPKSFCDTSGACKHCGKDKNSHFGTPALGIKPKFCSNPVPAQNPAAATAPASAAGFDGSEAAPMSVMGQSGQPAAAEAAQQQSSSGAEAPACTQLPSTAWVP